MLNPLWKAAQSNSIDLGNSICGMAALLPALSSDQCIHPDSMQHLFAFSDSKMYVSFPTPSFSLPDRDLGRALHVNVMGYDYSGYGGSSGSPSTRDTHADISAVLELLQHQHAVAPQQVVVYGQSIGSGPSVRPLGGERGGGRGKLEGEYLGRGGHGQGGRE